MLSHKATLLAIHDSNSKEKVEKFAKEENKIKDTELRDYVSV